MNQHITRETTAPDGTPSLQITGHAQATVTIQTTGESVTSNISGPGTIVIYPDRAFRVDAAVPNLLSTARANLANSLRPDDQLHVRSVPSRSTPPVRRPRYRSPGARADRRMAVLAS